MHFAEVECSPAVADKLASKHGVTVQEVEEALLGEPYVLRGPEGLYHALGRTDAGRYLFIAFRSLGPGQARIVTARDMDDSERRQYRRR
jgi:uncharacterized DUF497 family protein